MLLEAAKVGETQLGDHDCDVEHQDRLRGRAAASEVVQHGSPGTLKTPLTQRLPIPQGQAFAQASAGARAGPGVQRRRMPYRSCHGPLVQVPRG